MIRRLLIITGLSGSGKSTAARALEDQGFFVVDNLPLVMLPDFVQRVEDGLQDNANVAVVIDVRNRGFLVDQGGTFERLRQAGYRLDILFFEAADEVLRRRYSETRRLHPLAKSDSVMAGIQRERQHLHLLRESATQIIDSSNLTTLQLKTTLMAWLGEDLQTTLIVNLESFGYRYGVPPAADLVFDVRFLPNPHYIDNLRPLSGCDQVLRDYVLGQPVCQEFLGHLKQLLEFLIPHYHNEGKSYLTIAIGCTGGRHRSVSIVEHLNHNFPASRVDIRKQHRDIDKG